MAEWKEYRIGDLCNTISETYKGKDDEVILINTSDVLDGKILNHEKVPNENLKGQFKKTLRMNDILYSEIRPANKRFAFVDIEDTSLYIASTKLMVLRPNTSIIYPKFLFSILSSQNIIDDLQTLAETRSGTFPQITFSAELAPMKVMVPNKEIQLKILTTLESIQGKLENNKQINRNLWNQIDTWFMKLYSCKDTRRLKFGDVITRCTERVNDGALKVLSPISSGKVVLSEEFFTKQVYSKDIGKYLKVAQYEFCYNPARANIGSIGMNDFNFTGCVSPVYVVFKTSDNLKFYMSRYFKTENFKKEVILRSSGSVRQALSYDDLIQIEFRMPTDKFLNEFNEFYTALKIKIDENEAEINKLANIRDTLLPKLMSGKLDVSDLEI